MGDFIYHGGKNPKEHYLIDFAHTVHVKTNQDSKLVWMKQSIQRPNWEVVGALGVTREEATNPNQDNFFDSLNSAPPFNLSHLAFRNRLLS